MTSPQGSHQRDVRDRVRYQARLDAETHTKLEELASSCHRTRGAVLRHILQWGLTQTHGWIIDTSPPVTRYTLHLLLDPTLLQQVQEAAAAHGTRMAAWVREAVRRVTPEDLPASWRTEDLGP